jgi:hypothetical protein
MYLTKYSSISNAMMSLILVLPLVLCESCNEQRELNNDHENEVG